MSNNAPTTQLLVTSTNISEIMNRFYVKKKMIHNPRVIGNLKHLVEIAKDNTEDVYKLFQARKQILEYAGEVYIQFEIDSELIECSEELEAILQMLDEHAL
jgi:hypothetical protein